MGALGDFGGRLQRIVGLSGQVLSWIRSFLTERFQRACGVRRESVVADRFAVGCTTKLCTRATAVPSLHGRAVRHIVSRTHGASAHFYADDGQLYVNSLAADTDDAINCLQACVAAVEQWMKSNRLQLNPQKKTQLIWLGSQHQPTVAALQQGVLVVVKWTGSQVSGQMPWLKSFCPGWRPG